MNDNQWGYDEQGKPLERRSIPIHILNHIDERLETHMTKVDEQFASLRLELLALEKKSIERHNQLLDLMGIQVQKQQKLEDAFIKNEHGEPDISGHFYDHDHRRQLGEWWCGVKDKAFTKVIEWGVLAFCTWVAYSLWKAFLDGPHK